MTIEKARITVVDFSLRTTELTRSEPSCKLLSIPVVQNSGPLLFCRPVAYPIPSDGPVGELVARLGRNEYRPAHLHMVITVRIEFSSWLVLEAVLYPRHWHRPLDLKSLQRHYFGKEIRILQVMLSLVSGDHW